MSLTNFGGLLGFALEMETRNAAFFAEAAACCEPDKPLLEGLAKESGLRAKEIERTRRENVTEMILENLDAFEEVPFVRNPEPPREMAREEILSTARDLLNRSLRFYEEAGLILKRLPEVAQAFKSLAKKSRRDIGRLADLGI